jgi:hypothetical protein
VTTDSDPGFEFDVALSFAGEDREYVGTIANQLRARGIRLFYDQYEQVTLWGKDLYEHLDDVYNGLLGIACYSYLSTTHAKSGQPMSGKVPSLARFARKKNIFSQSASTIQKYQAYVLR